MIERVTSTAAIAVPYLKQTPCFHFPSANARTEARLTPECDTQAAKHEQDLKKYKRELLLARVEYEQPATEHETQSTYARADRCI